MLRAAESTAEGWSWLGDLGPLSWVTEGGTAELDDSGSVCPSCYKLMTDCYKKDASGGIQSDSSHSGSSQQLSTFFLVKICFCTVNDL